MAPAKPRRQLTPLDRPRLEEMAIRYVGKYATTRAKLRAYLGRKIRERGWAGDEDADLEGLAQRLADLGYVNDRAFALAKAQSLTSRGFGKRRVDERLRVAGIGDEEGAEARSLAEGESVESALCFAQRRKLGPFAEAAPDPKQREKALAAMVRAGHPFALARAITALAPGAEVDRNLLRERIGLDPT